MTQNQRSRSEQLHTLQVLRYSVVCVCVCPRKKGNQAIGLKREPETIPGNPPACAISLANIVTRVSDRVTQAVSSEDVLWLQRNCGVGMHWCEGADAGRDVCQPTVTSLSSSGSIFFIHLTYFNTVCKSFDAFFFFFACPLNHDYISPLVKLLRVLWYAFKVTPQHLL